MYENIIHLQNQYLSKTQSNKYNAFGHRINYDNLHIQSLLTNIQSFLALPVEKDSPQDLSFIQFVERILELAIAILEKIHNSYRRTTSALEQLNNFYLEVKNSRELDNKINIIKSFTNLKNALKDSSAARAYLYEGSPNLYFFQAPTALTALKSLAQTEGAILHEIRVSLQDLELITRPAPTMVKSARR